MSTLETMSILCVEDEPFALEEMTYFLRKRAGKVYGAADGAEGLAQFELHRPDVVIADLLMPGMDGMEMIRRIHEQKPSVHIVVVTSVNSVDTVLEAVDLGIDGYILKPLDFTELELKLQKISDTISAERGRENGPLDSIENRRMIEDSIKKGSVKIIKEYTGKGPRETIVQLTGSLVKITILGGLTVMEEHLAASRKNHEMLRHQRTVIYESMAPDLEKLISSAITRNVFFRSIETDLKKNIDRLEFSL